MNATSQRRTAIRDLIETDAFRSQDELRTALAGRGFEASQPVLSRDLTALGVAKQGGVYRVADAERVTPLHTIRSLLRSSGPAPHLAMVQCEPGAASAVARALEAEEIEGVLGSVAGDDTVLVVGQTAATSRRVRDRVDALIALAEEEAR